MGALVALRSLRREPDEPNKTLKTRGRLDLGRKFTDKENAEPSRLSNSEKIVF